ncbi:pyridoxamine kinase [Clostridium felsineum]|uniref:pyridoxal kinase n=1 Tax=Clostridium felsineum TaxID=36839 RepID=A0A1S8LU20_9CLOT|nr:pyridoxamine kinase [Clostridium felsineum]URZ06881.1 Pyridoxal kinase PdxY [Clostridium felsineum]URZ11913.1 Pyridoxal kinase PdxY [Clostridium felsineum]
MTRTVKRVAAIHDLSGFGRASLTAIIPILSYMGIQVCPMPTAVLSTHTTDFDDYSFVDLTDSMQAFMEHWRKINLEFDAIYTGFLGSPRQVEIISEFIREFSNENTVVLIDPVMGDEGKLYQTMDNKMVESMRELIKSADIITPNFTEAAYLLNKKYDVNLDEETIKSWILELAAMGPDIVIMTSVPESKDKGVINVIVYEKRLNKFWKVTNEYIPVSYPGTGDSFASAILGRILKGDNLPEAVGRGMQFVTSAIKESYGFNYPTREGILIEKSLEVLNLPFMNGSYKLI